MSRFLLTLFTACFLSSVVASTGVNSEALEQSPSHGEQAYETVGQPIESGPDSLAIASDQLGMTGPVTVTGTYSDTFGYTISAMYSQLINAWNALTLAVDYGDDENRFDVTWANQFSDHQRFKLSLERLEQALDFSFDSGEVTERVPQYSGGLGYQYLFNEAVLNDIELSGYYARAESDTLDTVTFEQNGLLYDNYRHIAGATSEGLETSVGVTPWAAALMSLGLNYDKVFYHNTYEDVDADDRAGFGYTLSLEQILSKHLKLSVTGSQRETNDSYQAMVSWLMHATATTDLEMSLASERIVGQDSTPNDNSISLAIAYYLDSQRYANGYHQLGQASSSDLKAWSTESLARMDMVLAAADQKTVLISQQSLADNSAPMLSSTQHQVELQAGAVNSIDLNQYLDELGITDLAQEKIRVFGGPSDIHFTYDQNQHALITATVVPQADIGKTLAPLHLVFINDSDEQASFSDKVANGDIIRLLLDLVVVEKSEAPQPNPEFISDQTVQEGVNFSTTFALQCTQAQKESGNCPATEMTLFLNDNSANNSLYVNDYGGSVTYPKNAGITVNQQGQNLVVKGTPNANFQNPMTISVVACNSATVCSTAPQTIVLNEDSPIIHGGALPAALAGTAYSYTYSSDEVNPGSGESLTFNTDSSYAEYYYNGQLVGDTNLETVYTSTTVTTSTKAGTTIPTQYATDPATHIDVVLYPTNSDGNQASNITKPFTLQVDSIRPVINGGSALTPATAGAAYSYAFTSDQVNPGEGTSFDTEASGATFYYNGAEVSDTNLVATYTASSVSIATAPGTTIPTKYGTDPATNISVVLTPVNAYGMPADNAANPFTIAVGEIAPVVNGGDALTPATAGTAYSYAFSAEQVNPGSGASFDTEASGAKFYYNGAEVSDTNLVPTYTASSVSIATAPGTTIPTKYGNSNLSVVLTPVNNYGVSSDNAANPFTIAVGEIAPVVNGGDALTPATAGAAYNYAFSAEQVSPGSGASFDTEASGAKFYYNGAEVSDTNLVPTYTASSVSIATASGTTIPEKYATTPTSSIGVVLTPVNDYGESADNAGNPFTITVNGVAPVVNGADLTSSPAIAGQSYTSTDLVASGVVTLGTGSIQSASVTYKDASGATITAVQLGVDVAYTQGGANLTLSGTPNAAYANTSAIKAYVTVTNSAGLSTTNAEGSPIYLAVYETPSFTATNLGTTTAGENYQSANLIGGTIDLGTGTIQSASVTYQDGDGNAISAANLGVNVSYSVGGTSLTLTGVPSSDYASDKVTNPIRAQITVQNSTGQTASNTFTGSDQITLTIDPPTVVTAFMSCPDPDQYNLDSKPSQVTVVDSAGISHTFLMTSPSSKFTNNLKFDKAVLSSSGQVLACKYMNWDSSEPNGDDYDYKLEIDPSQPLPVGTTGNGGRWSGDTCNVSYKDSDPVTDCEVTFQE